MCPGCAEHAGRPGAFPEERLVSVLGNFRWLQLLPVLALASVVALAFHATRGCGLDDDGTRCTASQESITKVRAHEYSCRLVAYRDVCGAFPTTEQGLTALLKAPSTPPFCRRYPAEPFIARSELPSDGFGEAFRYESDGTGFALRSPGRERWYRQNGWGSTGRAVDAGYPRAGINVCL
jgi:hypothetical protein